MDKILYNYGVELGGMAAGCYDHAEHLSNSLKCIGADMRKLAQARNADGRVSTTFDRVREFHGAFNHPVNSKPTVPNEFFRKLRVELIAEELKEFAEASGFEFNYKITAQASISKGDGVNVVETADALADLDYVVQGAMLVWGFPSNELGVEVHKSNMSKLGADGKPVLRDDGKILKGPYYKAPDIYNILRQHGYKG